jgi:hypothetical protein
MDIIRMDGKSAIVDCEVTIHVNSKPRPVEEPPQLDASEMEKRDIWNRLQGLASEIEDCLDGYPLSIPEVIALSGITEIPAVFEWRRDWDAQLAARYCAEIRPKVSGLYAVARARGFFNPELEGCYTSRLLVVARRLPVLLREAASACEWLFRDGCLIVPLSFPRARLHVRARWGQ